MSGIAELSGGRSLTHPAPFSAGLLDRTGNGFNQATLAASPGGDYTLVAKTSAKFHKITLTDSAIITLPAVAHPDSKGLSYHITHIAVAGALTIKTAAGATVVVLDLLDSAWVVCDGTTWIHMGVNTVAAS